MRISCLRILNYLTKCNLIKLTSSLKPLKKAQEKLQKSYLKSGKSSVKEIKKVKRNSTQERK